MGERVARRLRAHLARYFGAQLTSRSVQQSTRMGSYFARFVFMQTRTQSRAEQRQSDHRSERRSTQTCDSSRASIRLGWAPSSQLAGAKARPVDQGARPVLRGLHLGAQLQSGHVAGQRKQPAQVLLVQAGEAA